MRGTAGEGKRGRRAGRRAPGVYLGAYALARGPAPAPRDARARRAARATSTETSRDGSRRCVHDPRQRRLRPRALAQPRPHRRRAAQRLPGQRDAPTRPTRWRSTCPRSRVRARARRARGHPQRPEHRRAARLPASNAACTTPRRWPRSTSSSTRCARRSRWSPTRSHRRATDPGVPIEAIEARNVIDGRKLVDQSGPTGIAQLPVRRRRRCRPRADDAQRAAIDAEADGLLDVYDARGRPRAGGGRAPGGAGQLRPRRRRRSTPTSDATFPPEPEVVRTPAAGVGADAPRRPSTCSPGSRPAGRRPDAARDGRAGARPLARGRAARPRPPSAARCVWTDPVAGAPGARRHARRPRAPPARRARAGADPTTCRR